MVTASKHSSVAPVRVARFRLDGHRCAVAADAVREVLPAVAVRALPHQPAYVAGVMNLRGTVVPVLDVRVRLGLPARLPELDDRFIVVSAADRLLALWVDELEAFEEIDPSGWRPAGGLVAGDRTLTGVVATADGVTAIHDVAAFVAECEADAVYAAVSA